MAFTAYSCSLFCLVTEMTDLFDDTENMMAFFMVFHLIGVSSVCTNPILYGFLNDNFKRVSPNNLALKSKHLHTSTSQELETHFLWFSAVTQTVKVTALAGQSASPVISYV